MKFYIKTWLFRSIVLGALFAGVAPSAQARVGNLICTDSNYGTSLVYQWYPSVNGQPGYWDLLGVYSGSCSGNISSGAWQAVQ